MVQETSEDIFAVDKSYSPDKIYRSAVDKQGHVGDQRTKIPPYVLHAASEIAQHKATDYRTIADLVRDALYHRLVYWRDKLPELDDVVTLALQQQELDDKRVRQEDTKKMLELYEEQFKSAQPEYHQHLLDMLLQSIRMIHSRPELANWLGEFKKLYESQAKRFA